MNSNVYMSKSFGGGRTYTLVSMNDEGDFDCYVCRELYGKRGIGYNAVLLISNDGEEIRVGKTCFKNHFFKADEESLIASHRHSKFNPTGDNPMAIVPGLRIGAILKHKSWGAGVVTDISTDNISATFETVGDKKLAFPMVFKNNLVTL